MDGLKRMPVGRNWQYRIDTGVTLLRNVGSVDPANDGWLISHTDPRLESSHVHIAPELALMILRGLRLTWEKEEDRIDLQTARAALARYGKRRGRPISLDALMDELDLHPQLCSLGHENCC